MITPDIELALPLPVAGLVRRAQNAKSPKEQHDTAYYAWEVSVKLALAANPPADSRPLTRGSLGQWVRAMALSPSPSSDADLLRVLTLFTDISLEPESGPKNVSAGKLIGALTAYRNKVIGHGTVLPSTFYRPASPHDSRVPCTAVSEAEIRRLSNAR